MPRKKTSRLQIDIPESIFQKIMEIYDWLNASSRSEVIRRCIHLMEDQLKHEIADGMKIFIQHPGKEEIELYTPQPKRPPEPKKREQPDLGTLTVEKLQFIINARGAKSKTEAICQAIEAAHHCVKATFTPGAQITARDQNGTHTMNLRYLI
jgi:hypothetical protein